MKKLLLIIFCVACLKASSQKLFNVEADSMHFKNFRRLIESNSNYFFYYDTAQVNKLFVTVHAKAQSLDEILEKIFANTAFHFSIDEENHVFITGSFAIQTALPQNFLNKQTNKKDSLHMAPQAPQIDLAGNTGVKEKIKSPLENKLFEIATQYKNAGISCALALNANAQKRVCELINKKPFEQFNRAELSIIAGYIGENAKKDREKT